MKKADDTNVVSLRGGRRPGAGRKPGSGKFSEQTRVLRVPESQLHKIKDLLSVYQHKRLSADIDAVHDFIFPALLAESIALPLYTSKVSAGLPDQADDHVEKHLDPSAFLIDDKQTTFFVTIQGYSMMDAGLLPGDKAVVDRSKTASVGDIVLALLNGEFTIKTLSRHKNGAPRLLPANSSGEYSPIDITPEMHFEIWGVVTGSFRRFK